MLAFEAAFGSTSKNNFKCQQCSVCYTYFIWPSAGIHSQCSVHSEAESQDYKMWFLGGSVSQVFYSEQMHAEHLPLFPSHEERAGISCTWVASQVHEAICSSARNRAADHHASGYFLTSAHLPHLPRQALGIFLCATFLAPVHWG